MQKKRLIVMSTLLISIILLGIGTVAYIRRGVEGSLAGQTGNLVLIVNEANAVQNESFSISLNRSEEEPYVMPDDSGTFNINIDASGSSTDVEVTVNVTRTNLPDNLKFYTDSSYTIEITNQTYKITHAATMTKTIPVYWFWDGSVDDENDTLFMGKTIEANISVTAQVAVSPTLLETLLTQDNTLDTNVNFGSSASSTNGQGLMMREGTQNNTYPIVYYRGNVSNNNVIFADLCWLIVRTTETGGIKLVYNGAIVKNSDGTESCTNYSGVGGETANSNYTDVYVGNATTTFNTNFDSPVYVGYMYNDDVSYSFPDGGGTGSTSKNRVISQLSLNATLLSTVYEQYASHLTDNSIDSITGRHNQNKYDSNIKSLVDDWYKATILGKTEEILLEDTIWCNDRSIISETYTIENYASRQFLYFAALTRLYENTIKTPSLTCARDMDKFTVERSKGNGDLDYPIGLLTADEMNLAGFPYNNSQTTYLSLKTDGRQWTMSPYYYNSSIAISFVVNASNLHYSNVAFSNGGARPSISVNNSATILGGNGSFDSPYKIST